jgi:hypothetical protein
MMNPHTLVVSRLAPARAIQIMLTQIIQRNDVPALAVTLPALPAVLVATHSGTSTISTFSVLLFLNTARQGGARYP